MTENCPNPSCGRPIPPDQAMPWCLACGVRFPESLQLRLPKLQEAKVQASLAKGGVWVEETCVRCGTHFRTLALRDFLGFRERECPNCHQVTVSPLPWSYRITYWIFFGFLTVASVQVFRKETNLLNQGAFYAFLLIVALTLAIYTDLEIAYHQWSSRRKSNSHKPGETASLEGDPPARNGDQAPSLGSRWKVGFLILLASWFMVLFILDIPEHVIEIFHGDKADPSNLLLGLTWGACFILCPLLISAIIGNGLKLAQLWAAWLKGFKTFLIGCLVVLPCVLLYLASQGMMPLVGIEKGSQEESRLILLLLLMCIVLVPFWVTPLFRWLSRSPFADQVSWFIERWSPVSRHEK